MELLSTVHSHPYGLGNSPEIHDWYALKVHTRSEDLAATALSNRGYDLFAPIFRERRKYSDRMKLVDKPAFPGYIFCRFNPETKVPVLSSPAVEYIVGIAGVPLPISDAEIEKIRRAMEAGARPVQYLAVGQRVRIEYGSMTGVEGILTRVGGESRVTITVEALHRAIAVIVDSDQVRAV